ncbi:acylase [Streptomyces sp. A7024]|uniref:Acylase n=1 Tax=Streptomyces coryli TaxID=1128680 RepID=A0A6G4U1I7_9ACTN|nr:acylase [Streptomyces coryli]
MSVRARTRRFALPALALVLGAVGLPPATAAQERGGGLSAEIRYTAYGIPHIKAKDYAGLGFGTGYAQAQDMVCDLAGGFVTLRGERSRYFGADGRTDQALSSASTNLGSDLYFRGIRDSGTVERLLEVKPPEGPPREIKELTRGWTAGYNTWLKRNKVTDPACKGAEWVRPVTELDVASRAYALAVLGGQGMSVDGITAAAPPGTAAAKKAATKATAPEAAARAARKLFDRSDAAMGSNAVAFSGKTTANGRGLLLGNPHYPWAGGRRFWQSHQTIPGELNAAGASLLGSPTISIGHNSRVAWSHTVATGVPANIHELKLDPADPKAYLVDGKSEKMWPRPVTVETKDGKVTKTQWWTRYGPITTSLGGRINLPWTATTAYALNDPNAANLRATATGLGFSKARSIAGVKKALADTQGLPWVNTIAADAKGRTLFTQSQVLPRITDDLAERCSTPLGKLTYPVAGLAVLDGSRTDCALGKDEDAVQPGIFGPSRMPVLNDAPYAENSNDSAWLANADTPVTGYERVFGDFGTERSMRTRGAVEDVSAMAREGGLSVSDLQRQQFGTGNRAPAGKLAAEDLAKFCAALPGGTATGTGGRTVDVSGACPVLHDWDRTMRSSSRGALLFDRFWRKARAGVPAGQLWQVPFDKADPVRTPHTLNTAAPGVAVALADAVAELKDAGIALDAPLGKHQFVERNGKRLPIPGGTESLGVWNKTEPVWNAAGGSYTDVSTGSSYIQAVGWDGSPCPKARTLLTYSQSANPASPHYADQTRLYSRGRWVTPPFCEKDIRKATTRHITELRSVR